VAAQRATYDPRRHYDNDAETRAALDLIARNGLSPDEPGVFEPILDALIRRGDYYLHLADLESYCEAHARVGLVYADREEWFRRAVLNIAASGRFSSDRTIAEYAADIWGVEPCRVG
jgi:starch phosphorylase